jgi:hypothetical protein
MNLLPFKDVYIPTLQWAERQMKDKQWTLLHIGKVQGRQIQMYRCDKTQHKGFLTDLEFLGAFSVDVLAWGPGALSTNARGNPAFDMSAYIPCDQATSMPPDRMKRMGRISTPQRFEVAEKTVPPHLPHLVEQTAQGVRIQILFHSEG